MENAETLLSEIYHALTGHVKVDLENNEIKSVKHTVDWCIKKIDEYFDN